MQSRGEWSAQPDLPEPAMEGGAPSHRARNILTPTSLKVVVSLSPFLLALGDLSVIRVSGLSDDDDGKND